MGDPKHEARRIFTAALALDKPEERARYLDEACRGQPGLRQRVESLLRAHEQASEFLEPTGPEPLPASDFALEGAGVMVGNYKLLEQIGEGGFGVVFMAEQVEPIRRRVALKIVKPGMDTRQVLARFEAERQALALMDHPNIAKIFDAGATGADHSVLHTPQSPFGMGRPYFVMELVQGVRLTQFCDANDLSTQERLKLFMQVCQAVQHAHQKGIIHRDLKPSNILVTLHDGKPVPKVIDFGTAKALQQRLTEKTLFTAYGKLIGTPQYMSPEQAEMSGLDVDTRADIYSLGVILYELLTGTTPFEPERLRAAAFDEMMRIIRQEDPPRPSTRVSTLGARATEIAKHRQVAADLLQRSLRGDLDWIVMKALDKDRSRRYETASSLLDDVERYLGHQPVLASPPGVVYRARKFAQRHRVGVVMTAGVALAMLAGLIMALTGFSEARRQRDRAVQAMAEARGEAAISAAVNQFLLDDLLRQAAPDTQPDRDVKLRTLIDRAADNAAARFRGQPLVELPIRLTLSLVYESLGELRKARLQLDRAMEISREQNLPADHPQRLELQDREVNLLTKERKPEEAATLAEKILLERQQVLGTEHPETLTMMFLRANACAVKPGNQDEAQSLYEELLPVQQRVLGAEHPEHLRSLHNLANIYGDLGKLDEARKIYEEVLPVLERVQGPEHPMTLMARQNLANNAQDRGELDEAQALYEALLPVQQRVLGPEHLQTLKTELNLAMAYAALGKPAEACRRFEALLPMQEKALGQKHPDTLLTQCHLANAYTDLSKPDQARTTYERILPLLNEVYGSENVVTLIARVNLGISYENLEMPDEARLVYEAVLPVLQRVLGPDDALTLDAANSLDAIKQRQNPNARGPDSAEE